MQCSAMQALGLWRVRTAEVAPRTDPTGFYEGLRLEFGEQHQRVEAIPGRRGTMQMHGLGG